MKSTMHIGIIGAGPGGINAARHALANNFTCTVFEQNGGVGGTWLYTDDVDVNELGIPVHSSLYQGLMSNLPKQTMEYPDHSYPPMEKSYLQAEEVLAYFKSYVKKFHLEKHIKFYHQVQNVLPLENNRWSIRVRDLSNQTETTHEFDAVIVSSGHYHTPVIPKLPGMETFSGNVLHSHSYRSTSGYENQRILMIGVGASGLDIMTMLSDTAQMIFLSHHKKGLVLKLPNHVVVKPDVKEIREKLVVFDDGSEEEVDTIILCTGYKYNYPFIDPQCGIQIEDGQIVTPLYKHMINIHHPTMALLGVINRVIIIRAVDLQNRVFFASLTGKFQLPTKAEMFEDLRKEFEAHLATGKPKKSFHCKQMGQREYYADISRISGQENIPTVLLDLTEYSSKIRQIDLKGFRRIVYRVIDAENFELVYKPDPIW